MPKPIDNIAKNSNLVGDSSSRVTGGAVLGRVPVTDSVLVLGRAPVTDSELVRLVALELQKRKNQA